MPSWRPWGLAPWLAYYCVATIISSRTAAWVQPARNATIPALTCDSEILDVMLIKVGGSSITHKAAKETLNEDNLSWFASVLASEISSFFKKPKADDSDAVCSARNSAFVIVHGAGSFGHHTAKEYGLKGHSTPPALSDFFGADYDRRRAMAGLTETRLSVRKLSHEVVSAVSESGINAVGISPCFSIPGMQAHGGDPAAEALLEVVQSTLQAGLVPILHGDACLYGGGAGILSGDILMEILGRALWISEVVFLTDVDGVFTKDPRTDATAELIRTIKVDEFAEIRSSSIEASQSMHSHDVTGGLKVRNGVR